ncbi:rhomboid domain-containing protein 2 isoform X2 [Silurus meridionalis]|uniref:rhomboid domain-containing protein 2 isoform X2 n=1 Tax=Silurus meridionalis TaxID=175797 RepID=UPI001EEA2D72|nr:rhomboid domain-containing protein 2 isoform X2 [Silurus meridionalis]
MLRFFDLSDFVLVNERYVIVFTVKMCDRFRNILWKFSSFVPAFEFTSGVGFVVTLSCVLSIVANHFNISAHALSLESSVVLNGHVHKLLTYCFYHKDVGHLFLSATLLVAFCSGLERGVGTVRFLHLLLFLVTSVGLIHVLLEVLLFSPYTRSTVSGLIPVSLSMLGTVTMSSRVRKAFLLGFTVPSAVLPWLLLLIVHLFIPNTVLLCNALAAITGQMYGMKWFSMLQMSESKACMFEKMMPFRLLKKVTCVHFVPASAGERKKILHTICSPSPGSYPVQAYAPASMLASQAAGNALNSVDGWSHSTIIQQNFTVPSLNPGYNTGPRSSHGHTQGHVCGNSHGHSHQNQKMGSTVGVHSAATNWVWRYQK